MPIRVLIADDHSIVRQGLRVFLAQDPDMQPHVAGVERDALASLDSAINAAGAEISGSHYIGASLEPTLNALLQMQQLGGPDAFASDPRLAAFARFYLGLLSPADARYGGRRKVVASRMPWPTANVRPCGEKARLQTGRRASSPPRARISLPVWASRIRSVRDEVGE